MNIKVANTEEIKTMVKWAQDEGWNPGENDAEVYYLADPKGFFVGYKGEEMVVCISAVKYHDFGFVGLYIVKPEYRGHGYGWQIWQHAMKYLAGCNVALDGVVEQQHNYRKSGFKLAHNNIRYQWTNLVMPQHKYQSIKATEYSFESLQKYLRPFFPANRSNFIQAWQNQDNAKARLITIDNEIKAYGVIRSCDVGYKIGPLFAANAQLADNLINDLTAEIGDAELVFLDITERNTTVLPLLKKRKAEEVFATARMYTGDEPDIGLSQTFGITSFEIG